MNADTQRTSETKLDELKRLCQPMRGEPMRMVSRLELLALVECAEAAGRYYKNFAVDEAEDLLTCVSAEQHEAAKRLRDAVAKLEAL